MSVNSVVKHCVMPKDMYVAKMWKSEKVYIGETGYDLVISPASRKNGAIQYHVAALLEGKVLSFEDLNESLYDVTVQKYIDELNARMASCINQHVRWVNTGNHDIYVSYGSIEQWEDTNPIKSTGIRLILMVKNVEQLPDTEEQLLRKLLKAELVEWMEAVLFDKPAVTQTKEDYEKDLVRIMDPSMLPHTDTPYNPVPLVTIIGGICCVLGVWKYPLFIFQINAMVVSAYASYRSYKKGMSAFVWINLVILAVSMYMIYYGSANPT